MSVSKWIMMPAMLLRTCVFAGALFVWMSFGVSAAEEAPPATDTIIIAEGYELLEGEIAPGSDARIAIALKNMSTRSEISNILVSVTGANNSVYIVDGVSNQFFLRNIKAGATETVEIPLRFMDAGNAGDYVLNATVSYYTSLSRSVVSYPLSFVLSDGSTGGGLYLADFKVIEVKGKKAVLELMVSNKSTERIEQVAVSIDGDVINPCRLECGSIAAGRQARLRAGVELPEGMSAGTITARIHYNDLRGRAREGDATSLEVQEDLLQTGQMEEGVPDTGRDRAARISSLLFLMAVLTIAVYRRHGRAVRVNAVVEK